MKSFKLNLCIFFATTMMLYSCQKENPASVSNSNSNEKEMVNLDEPPIVDTICVENDDEVCSSIGQGSGGFVPTHAIPNAVVQLFQDPDYGDYYYFDSLYHDCSLDTSGYYYYTAPSKYWPNEYLSIAVEGGNILMYYVIQFPENMDWEYCYNHNETVPVYAYLYDGTGFFSGTYDVRQGVLNVSWVNSNLFDLDSKLPRPGWDTFCDFWDYFGLVSSLTFGIGCPPAGIAVSIVSFVVTRSVCR